MEILNLFTSRNFDLLSVGIATAAMLILGLVAFLNNKKSITNRTFLLFAIFAVLWSFLNYFIYQFQSPVIALTILRFAIFFATWYSFYVFQLFYVFPEEEFKFPRWYSRILLPLVLITSALTLTPVVFEKIEAFSTDGRIARVTNGPGIFVFAGLVLVLVGSGMQMLFDKMAHATGERKKQFRLIFTGALISYFLIILFNLILPAFFGNARFTPLGALFLLPLVAFAYYAVVRHHLLNIKLIATEILTLILAIVTLLEIVLSRDVIVMVFRTTIFALVLVFGILLIRSVRREVEQREKLERLTGELEAANERLREVDRMKSQFYSFVSHQIKTPIGIIKGFTSLLLDGSYGIIPDHAKETIRKMKDAADRLITLVENFLDLRKIESGKMEYVFEDVDVVNLVRKMVEELKPLAARKNLALAFHSEHAKCMVKADAQRLTNVFQNLIDNAIKYTEQGWVKVEIATSDPRRDVFITVSDSGRGMSKDLLPTLFEQYTRDATVVKTIAGTGLGLYLAKEIVKGHQGEVWAESDGEGKGSRFIVRLPVVL